MSQRRFLCLTEAMLLIMTASASFAISVSPDEMAEARNWAAAKLMGRPESAPPRASGLVVLANNDPVQLNIRNGRPMKIAGKEYARGLYCHAVSKVAVRLPAPGKSFSAVVGVDSNEQTSGGRGSVVFSVSAAGKKLFESGTMHEGTAALPVSVDLAGAAEFVLEVGDAGDGIACDQSDWADAKAVLEDGREIWLGDMALIDGTGRGAYTTDLPFSFTYGGASSRELLKSWNAESSSKKLDDNRTEQTTTYTDPKTGLQVRWVAVEYADFPTVEWTLHFKNAGSADTPIISDIRALDTRIERSGNGEFVLHHAKGTFVRADDFEPLTSTLGPEQRMRFAPPGGRPCGAVWPYFNLQWQGEGAIVVVGWPGQWDAEFARDATNGVAISAGQEKVHLTLHSGEEIRSPLVVVQFYKGDWLRAQNVWRRWMMAHSMPRPAGKLPPTQLTPCSSHQYGEMINANEENQKMFVDRYVEEGLKPDYWWMDAGWYVNATGWPNTGTWEVDTKRFPNGLRAISDHARAKGVKTLVWFEPERVTGGTWLWDTHPDWLIGSGGGQKLLNLGNPEALKWLTNHVDKLLVDQGIDLYRQDYNIDPLAIWRETDTPDRQGITENHYVTGYLAYWDELRRRHPNMLIDSCASGGHRNDLETLRRSVPLLRSDYILEPIGQQGHTYGLAYWLPYFGTGDSATDAYRLRGSMLSGFIACWDMRRKDLPYELFRKLVGQWRQYAANYFGDYYPLTQYSLGTDQWIAWQFDRPEAGEGMIQAFRRQDSVYESARLKLQGLDPKASYTVADVDSDRPAKISGKDLMEKGLKVEIAERPGAVVIRYSKAK